MAVDPPSTHHSHLDPSDLCLRLTSRSSYGRKYRSTAYPTFNPKEKGGEHTTRSGSCYRRDPSAEDSTDSSPEQVARVETPRRSIHRKRTPESRSQERDSWKIVPRYPSPEQSPPREESGYPTGDLGEHVYLFETNMLLLQVSDAVTCRAFPTTLRKAAHAWFKSLQPRSIYSYGQLSDLFQKHFENKIVRISSNLKEDTKLKPVNLLRTYADVFAWTAADMPEINLETENMNRSILQGLKKKLDEAKGIWVDELPKVLWAYRTTPHSVTGETPFLLYYGTEAMLPVEIGVPTMGALHFNEVGLRANLDLVEEARTQAHELSVAIKQRVARYYN
ncbi:hypothetical protein RJ639_035478 [Escallonia herrerae]|uniref:Retrotransposon gag domain-containing protein n=1 Tax=Escallonia herrerae TaxID=1293975 RepID=A0AA89BHH8_9ASTE|nr:hypothetical protein RJ639_035478 [Escallonia herrerae]